MGPRGDGYIPSALMTADEAERYHAPQIEAFRDAQADMVAAFTLNYPAEAIGITRAAQKVAMPVAISFTLETDGHLPDGQPLTEGIQQVDSATDHGPAYYLINCAHPTHFESALAARKPALDRIRGIRANASRRSHAELNEATELDDGNPAELALQYSQLRRRLPQITILGGCCGTDARHVEAICKSCLAVH
jgi:S-methylmethionine-dependent homocysteine/selenocysteine methylase